MTIQGLKSRTDQYLKPIADVINCSSTTNTKAPSKITHLNSISLNVHLKKTLKNVEELLYSLCHIRFPNMHLSQRNEKIAPSQTLRFLRNQTG